MKRVLILPGLIVLLALFAAAGLMATAPELKPEAREPVAPTVRVIRVQPESVELRVHSQGTVQPRTESALIPEVSGRVEWVSPALVSGGMFDAGEDLLRIESADYETALARARAALAQAEAEEANARFEHERRMTLVDRRLVSRSDVEAAERRLKVAEAALQSVRGGLEQALRDLERTRLQAPFAGVVRTESVDVGQFVNRGNPVATLYARDVVEIRLPLADAQLAWLDLPLRMRGELALEDAPEVVLSAEFAGRERSWQGRVVRTEGEIDPDSRMVHVVARVADADPPIPVGLFVEAEIRGRRVDDIISLPRSVLRDGNRLLVVDDENRLYYRTIEPLRLYRDRVLIRAGLRSGERVCISPIQTVVEGMRVAPVAEPV
ncbi:MAG: efflux RND transporter periplasmic adaptor subunit [Gammaproteobacteria bacterium]|nr:efflux RND transporter periplasmic adaptor subunit [Gammaproteobacteria bacterium]